MGDAAAKSSSKKAAFAARLVSTLLLWGIIAGVFVSGRREALVGIICVLALLGVVEFFRLTRSVEGRDTRIWSLVVSSAYVLWLAVAAGTLCCWEPADMLGEAGFLVVAVLGAFVVRLRHGIEGPQSVFPIALGVLSFIYVPILFGAFMVRLAFLPPVEDPQAGFWLLLLVVVTTKFTDMGAYLVGSLIGKHKAIPHVSPAKSWEGYIGSVFFAVGGALGIFYWGGESLSWMGGPVIVGVLAVLLALAAMLGDLAESILKRSLHVKDSGSLLPGIGGILDLIDSLCFAAPVAYLFLRLFVV